MPVTDLGEFEPLLTGLSIPYETGDVWLHCELAPITRTQGWKLHVSAVPFQAIELAGRAARLCVEHNVPFKLARSIKTLHALNDGELGETQIGKFLTAYPPDDNSAVKLADCLIDATQGFLGPQIITDFWLGGTVYSRYGSFSPTVRRDRFGLMRSYVMHGDEEVIDDYKIPFESPQDIEVPFKNYRQSPWYEDAEVLRGKHVLAGKFLILDVIKSKPRGSVYLAISRAPNSTGRLCVVKEGRQGTFSDQLGRDIRDRLRHQYELLEALRGTCVPEPFDLFSEYGSSYLVVEFVPGLLISEFFAANGGLNGSERRTHLTYLIKLIDVVIEIHNRGVVHRDLTPNNIMISDEGNVFLIDLELSIHLDNADNPFERGTPGYISPQQQNGDRPQKTDDIYALGATLLNLITGIDPRKLLHVPPERRVTSFAALAGCPRNEALIFLVATLDPDPEKRPLIEDLRRAFVDYRDGIACDQQEAVIHELNKAYLRKTYDGLLWGTAKSETDGLFVSAKASKHANDTYKYELLRSANHGMAGVLYTLARFHRAGISSPEGTVAANHIVDWLLRHEPTGDDQLPGLHFGEAGVAVALAESLNTGLIETGDWVTPYFFEVFGPDFDWPDMTHGAAGQGMAALICADLLEISKLKDYATRCSNYLLSQQTADGCWALPGGVPGMEGTRYTGFAHGTAGILHYLYAYAAATGDHSALQAADRGLDWLGQHCSGTGDKRHWPVEPGDTAVWQWWCHGGPGIALSYLASYALHGRRQHAEEARKILSSCPADLRTEPVPRLKRNRRGSTFCAGRPSGQKNWQIVHLSGEKSPGLLRTQYRQLI